MRLLSFGAGVQSTALLRLSLEGVVEPFDQVLFADTGGEPRAVYEHVARTFLELAELGIGAHVVQGGDVLTFEPFGKGSALDVPFFLRYDDGKPEGIGRRQCTSKLKIGPMRRKTRELMRAAGVKRAELAIGISVDEWHRMRRSDVKYLEHVYPLVDLELTRADCERILEERGIAATRSACVMCPYHSASEWRRLKAQPEEWARVVAFDRELRLSDHKMTGTPYLHRARVPIDEVDLSSREDAGQLTLDECAEGVCFT